MRILAMGSLAALAVLSASAMWMTSATAQQPAQTPCGPASYSVAEQRQVGMPCTSPTAKVDGSSQAGCGPAAYSVAEQRQVGMPCTSSAPKAEGTAQAPCGPAAYSVAEQRQVGMPCP